MNGSFPEPSRGYQGPSSPASPSTGSLQESQSLTGQMTLADIERRYGIPTQEMAKRLHLPPGVPADETLGRLRQQYPFTMDEVRGIIAEYGKDSPSRDGSGATSTPDPIAALHGGEHHEEPNPATGRGSADQPGILVTGQTSLRDIEKQTGIPARVIAKRLGLPPEISPDLQLGKVRKMYPITMQQVREAVTELMKKAEP